jgi:hypothetical protein
VHYQLESLLTTRHSHESGNPDFQRAYLLGVWVPAFAGMTVYLDSIERLML